MGLRALRFILAICLLVSTALATGAQASERFAPPREVATERADIKSPEVALGGDRRGAIVWERRAPQHELVRGEIRYATVSGSRVSAPRTIDGVLGAKPSAVVGHDGTVTIAFVSDRVTGGLNDVLAYRVSPDGQLHGPETLGYAYQPDNRQVALVVDEAGSVTAAWEDGLGLYRWLSQIKAARITPSGEVLPDLVVSSDAPVHGSTMIYGSPLLAADARGFATVVWDGYGWPLDDEGQFDDGAFETRRTVAQARRIDPDGGLGVLHEVAYADPPGAAGPLGVAGRIGGGALVLTALYPGFDGSNNFARDSFATPITGADELSSPVPLDVPDRMLTISLGTDDRGRTVLAGARMRGGRRAPHDRIEAMRIKRSGGAGESVKLSPYGTPYKDYDPSLATGRRSFVAWHGSPRRKPPKIRVAELLPHGPAGLGYRKVLAMPGGRSPKIAVDASGAPGLVWLEGRPADRETTIMYSPSR